MLLQLLFDCLFVCVFDLFCLLCWQVQGMLLNAEAAATCFCCLCVVILGGGASVLLGVGCWGCWVAVGVLFC